MDKLKSMVVATAVVFLAGCATVDGERDDVRVSVAAACEGFAETLTVLAGYRATGDLDPWQERVVDDAIQVVTPICTAPEPPEATDIIVDVLHQVGRLSIIRELVS